MYKNDTKSIQKKIQMEERGKSDNYCGLKWGAKEKYPIVLS